jgi:hypothetical protein
MAARAQNLRGVLVSNQAQHRIIIDVIDGRRATAELLAALVKVAIAHGRRHFSQSGEPLATTLAVLECLQRETPATHAAAPPSSAMNSRRFIRSPRRRGRASYPAR